MPQIEPTAELNEEFSSPDATARPWAEVVDVLSKSELFWLSTVRRDGRPHVTPLPAIWLDGALHFCTGTQEQKTRNMESNPRCILTTGTNQFRSGLDVVVEGDALRVTEHDRLARLAEAWATKWDGRWRFEVRGDSFQHPDRDVQALVYAVAPKQILAFAKGTFSQTRHRF
jgi:general stress protein 26